MNPVEENGLLFFPGRSMAFVRRQKTQFPGK